MLLNQNIKIWLITLLSLVFVELSSLSAQTQTDVQYSSFPVGLGARAAGFADGYVADAYDINSMYWNPGALVYIEHPWFVLNHRQERYGDNEAKNDNGEDKYVHSMIENIALPLHINKDEIIGLGMSVTHVGYIGRREKMDFRVIQYGYDIAYAREIIPTLSLGALINVQYAKSQISSLWAFASSFGVFYSPSPEFTYGASLHGIGNGILYTSNHTTTTLTSERLHQSIQAGITLRFPPEGERQTFTLSVANEKKFGETGIRYMGGVEVLPIEYIALRGGYYVTNNWAAARFGIGFKYSEFQLDIAVSPSKLTDQAFQTSIAVRF